MGRHTVARIAGALCVAGVLFGCGEDGATIEIGASVSHLNLGPSTESLVVWAVRPEDYVTCQSVTRVLRRIQRTSVGVDFLVIVLGPDDGFLRSLLRVERVDARQIYLKPGGFSKLFGRAYPPFLFVVDEGEVAALWSGGGQIHDAVSGERPRLMKAVGELAAS